MVFGVRNGTEAVIDQPPRIMRGGWYNKGMAQKERWRQVVKKMFTRLAPLLGAGAVGACPLCWIGSASLLTYLGLGALIPVWRWIVGVLLGLRFVGFLFDYRSHKNVYPLVVLVAGGVLLYLGRYVFGVRGLAAGSSGGVGAVLVLFAIVYNKRQFIQKPHTHQKQA